MQVRSARDLLTPDAELFPAESPSFCNPLVFINDARHAHAPDLCDVLPLYAAGPAPRDSVLFGRYRGTVLVDARRQFLALTDIAVIEEQLAPWIAGKPDDLAASVGAMAQDRAGAMTIDAEALMVGRYGDHVWGHWLEEMLPKIVLAEAFFPGRFSYVVSAATTLPDAGQTYSRRVLESLAAYGVTPDRLLRLPPGYVCAFTNLFDIVGCWQAGLHSAVAGLMRAIVADVAPDPARRVMALRGEGDTRRIYNCAEIAALLAAEGFVAADPRRLSFLEQARLFAGAGMVAGELGSNLAGMIYAPQAVRLLSFAPMGWLDSYFLSTIKQLGGFLADVRGASTYLGAADRHVSPFVIDPQDVRTGLSALARADQTAAPLQVWGQMQPRAVGAVTLRLAFGQGGNGVACLRGDWHAPEPGLCWCASDTAAIELDAGLLPVGDHWMEVRGFTVAHKAFMPVRALTLRVNGAELVRTSVSGNVRVMAPVRGGGRLTIELDVPVVGEAQALGAAGDTRRLGLGLRELAFFARGA